MCQQMWQNGGMPAAPKPPTGPLSHAVAGILRAQKGKLDVTDAQIGKAAHISRSQVGHILNGVKHVDVEQLDQLCYALGLNLLDVIKEAETETSTRKVQAGWPARPLRTLAVVAGK
jgi:transcriptional regulator with XRE-family HTH domain